MLPRLFRIGEEDKKIGLLLHGALSWGFRFTG